MDKINLLSEWCNNNNVRKESIKRIFDMLELGKRNEWELGDPSQYPSYYLQDDNASPWHNPDKYDFTKILTDNYNVIKEEALNAVKNNQNTIHPDNNNFAEKGSWRTYFFYKNGLIFEEHLKQCPNIAKIINQIDGIQYAGRTYLSTMAPGTHIKTHCGPHNFKLRFHLGINIPNGARIRVSNKTIPWSNGKVISFDDSFDHEVWNDSNEDRTVLIIDIWNPSLSKYEISALKYIMPEFYSIS